MILKTEYGTRRLDSHKIGERNHSWWPIGNSYAYVQSGTQGYVNYYIK